MKRPFSLPANISTEAWTAAMGIDEAVSQLLEGYGMTRREGRSKSIETVAKIVQHAINCALSKQEGATHGQA